jgi:ubiquitin-conjugating enzyme (huntingtin interacting protein 2)
MTPLMLTQIDVLRRLNYRGANVANISEDRIVEELLK